MEITDRIAEQKILATRLASTEAELIAIYGRRRVGKTFLVRLETHTQKRRTGSAD